MLAGTQMSWIFSLDILRSTLLIGLRIISLVPIPRPNCRRYERQRTKDNTDDSASVESIVAISAALAASARNAG